MESGRPGARGQGAASLRAAGALDSPSWPVLPPQERPEGPRSQSPRDAQSPGPAPADQHRESPRRGTEGRPQEQSVWLLNWPDHRYQPGALPRVHLRRLSRALASGRSEVEKEGVAQGTSSQPVPRLPLHTLLCGGDTAPHPTFRLPPPFSRPTRVHSEGSAAPSGLGPPGRRCPSGLHPLQNQPESEDGVEDASSFWALGSALLSCVLICNVRAGPLGL